MSEVWTEEKLTGFIVAMQLRICTAVLHRRGTAVNPTAWPDLCFEQNLHHELVSPTLSFHPAFWPHISTDFHFGCNRARSSHRSASSPPQFIRSRGSQLCLPVKVRSDMEECPTSRGQILRLAHLAP